jgi:hypothetical protein
MFRRSTFGLITATALVIAIAACASDGVTGTKAGPGKGVLAVKLTDAPLPLDSVKEVNVFVERIDARRERTDSDSVSEHLDDDGHEVENEGGRPDSTHWVTIATPNKSFNLLALQNGVTAFLGATPVDTGHFKSVRLIIDPAKSNIVLKDGTVLTTTSTPPIEFENSHRHGLLVELQDALEVGEGSTTTVTLDLKLNESITLRGRTVRDGFLFRPVVDGRSHRDD